MYKCSSFLDILFCLYAVLLQFEYLEGSLVLNKLSASYKALY